MNVVYVFRELSALRILYYRHNPDLFRLLSGMGCHWDNTRGEFIICDDIKNEHLIKPLINYPVVVVTENSFKPAKVFNFISDSLNAISGARSFAADREKNGSIKEIDDTLSEACRFIYKNDLLPEKMSAGWQHKLETALRFRKYSFKTQKAYIYYNRLFFRTLQKTPEEVCPDDVPEFLAIIDKQKDNSASAVNLAISAVKFFFKYILNNNGIKELHRPRQDKRLPMVLSKEEILKILRQIKNPKHKLLLMLVYSSGLRVSEVVALKKEHIDISRQVIFIKLGKGRKDRFTMLSAKVVQFINKYYEAYDINEWIFPGKPLTNHLTIRSAQYIFDRAVKKAGIVKKISIHGLRHTFATHLIESGIDIHNVKTLMGHACIKTTERYIHVSRRNVLNIKSPLDSIL